MSLYIYPKTQEQYTLLAQQLKNHRWSDSGFDIPMPERVVDLKRGVYSFNLDIRVAATRESIIEDGLVGPVPSPCLLLPRSSIYKTPFRLCNSIGLIDAGYRGDVQAKVDIHEDEPGAMLLEHGTRLFQIVRNNFLPWNKIVLVDTESQLPNAQDTRGMGGFGSTGLQVENHPRT